MIIDDVDGTMDGWLEAYLVYLFSLFDLSFFFPLVCASFLLTAGQGREEVMCGDGDARCIMILKRVFCVVYKIWMDLRLDGWLSFGGDLWSRGC